MENAEFSKKLAKFICNKQFLSLYKAASIKYVRTDRERGGSGESVQKRMQL